jgi:hypothetical protein
MLLVRVLEVRMSEWWYISGFLTSCSCCGYGLASGCVLCCFRVLSLSSRGLPWNAIFVSIGVYSGLCIVILNVFFQCFLALCGQCVICTNGCVRLVLLVISACKSILCGNIYNAAVCWRGVEPCVLMFCILTIFSVEYRILKIRELFVHLFILLVRTNKFI